jgi:hypothetical protein
MQILLYCDCVLLWCPFASVTPECAATSGLPSCAEVTSGVPSWAEVTSGVHSFVQVTSGGTAGCFLHMFTIIGDRRFFYCFQIVTNTYCTEVTLNFLRCLARVISFHVKIRNLLAVSSLPFKSCGLPVRDELVSDPPDDGQPAGQPVLHNKYSACQDELVSTQ